MAVGQGVQEENDPGLLRDLTAKGPSAVFSGLLFCRGIAAAAGKGPPICGAPMLLPAFLQKSKAARDTGQPAQTLLRFWCWMRLSVW